MRYLDWEQGVRERMSMIKAPSESFADFVRRYTAGVRRCSENMASAPGSFERLCLRTREDEFLRQTSQGAFGKDLGRPAGTWADGMSPTELGVAYFVLFGRRMPKPAWVDDHKGTVYPRRRENPYFSLKEKSLVARASDSETATKPL